MISIFPLLVASVAIQVQTSDARGLSATEMRDAVVILLDVLARQGTEACWSQAPTGTDAELPDARRCIEPIAPEILSVELFAGISRVRWIFTRRSSAGAQLGQLELDLLRRAPERDRLERGLLWLLPPKDLGTGLGPASQPSPAIVAPSSSPWPAVVGVGGGCAFGAGAALLISAILARQSLDTQSRDLEELRSLEDRRILHGAIGGALVGAGVVAVLAYVLSTSDE